MQVLKFLLAYQEENAPLKKISTVESQEDFRLDGKIIQELEAVSLTTCTQKCLHHSNCQSINVLVDAENFSKVKVCQLMLDDLQSMPNGLITASGWMYNDIEVGG